MEGGVVTDIIVPICLALMMVGLGMTLTPEDFKKVAIFPRAAITGLIFQMIVLPLVGFGLAGAFPLKAELAVGVMLLAACPGGVASNVITHLAKGDTALAVTLTIISSSLSLISIPLIVSLSLVHFMGADSSVEFSVLETVIKVFILIVPTVSFGMVLKARTPAFADKSEKFVSLGGLIFLIFLVISVAVSERELLVRETANVGPVCISLCVLTMGLGYFVSRLLAINKPQSVSIAIGTGYQNSALALVIATSFLKNAQIAISPAFYTLAMYVAALSIVGYMNIRKKEANPE
jgi:BASS family bile acid:Na+ symporter